MHFRRSLAGVALLGVFAAMAFAGAATGAPAQPQQSAQLQQSAATPLPGSREGTKLNMVKVGVSSLQAVPGRQVETNPYNAVQQQLSAKQSLLTMGTDRVVPNAQRPAALPYKAPAGLNATAAATVDQPIVGKDLTTVSRTGVNAWQQETFSPFGANLEPPDPTVCAGNNFAVQVVNAQVQISDVNLNHLTAPVSLEAFFGEFDDAIFDPSCNYNHSTGKWYILVAVSDGFSFSGVYIATSTDSDPRSPYNIYFLDLGHIGGNPPGVVPSQCAVGLCLADNPMLGSDQYTISISVNQFDISGGGPGLCVSGFCGAVFVLMDKVAMSLGQLFPQTIAFDISGFPTVLPDFLFGNCITGLGACWSSISPADASNGRYDTRQGGTTWAMSSLDFFGGGDNRIAVWQFRNTQTIGAFIPNIILTAALLDIGHNTYADPPLAAQPQTATGPGVDNGNPLGDFLVSAGLCSAGTPPDGCSNPGPIQTNDARMQDATLTRTGASSWIMWGGLNTDATAAGLCPCPGAGGRVGIMLFGVHLGPLPLDNPLDTTSLANVWTIHNPSNDVYYPGVAILDNGLTLASYGVSGPSLRPSAAYSLFSSTLAPSSIKIANQGLGVQDGFTQYNCIDFVNFTGTCGVWRPRYGDTSGAATMLNQVFFTTEYIPDSNCSFSFFVLVSTTCGPSQTVPGAQKRTFFANWGTSLDRASPTSVDHHTDPHLLPPHHP